MIKSPWDYKTIETIVDTKLNLRVEGSIYYKQVNIITAPVTRLVFKSFIPYEGHWGKWYNTPPSPFFSCQRI